MKSIGDVISLKAQIERKLTRWAADTHFLNNVENSQNKIEELRKRLEFVNNILGNWNTYQWLLDDKVMDSYVLELK
jgi:hypothetical protein